MLLAPKAAPRARRTTPLFGFRASDYLRLSGFGIRLSALSALSLRAANPISPDDIPSLRPPHAEIPPTFWEQYGLWVVILGIVLLGVVCAFVWWLTRPKPPVVVPPEVLARAALEPLRRQSEDGVLLSRVSQILRHYVGAAFDLPPGELTTSEFCQAIAGHHQIGPDLSAALSEFLHECDQLKFSASASARPLSAVPQALKLINQSQGRRVALAQPAAQRTPNAVAPASKAGIEK